MNSNPASRIDPEQRWFVGVDVGGTSIKLGLISTNCQVADPLRLPTNQQAGPEDAIQRIRAALQPAFQELGDQICGVGLGTPGPLDTDKGLILDPVNMPGWRNFPVRDQLSKALERPVIYTNDANAAAYGEYWCGNWRDCDSLVLITLGTGVGTGIILQGEPLTGANGQAAECGHMSVAYGDTARTCHCGRPGHLEAYSSASAVADFAVAWADEHPASELAKLLKLQGSLSARDVYDCALRQDVTSIQLIDQTAEYLARGIANLAQTIDPHTVLLGGAMDFGGADCEIGQRFLMAIQQRVRQRVFTQIADKIRIEFASLGGSAGWIGAAGLANRDYDQQL